MSNTLDLTEVIPANYQRAFFFPRLGYLLSDIVLQYYRKRDFLTIYSNGILGTYISNRAAEWASQNGKEIFSSEQDFRLFEKGFRDVIAENEAFITEKLKKTLVTLDDFIELSDLVSKVYYYFEKTEFFFTDGCYQGQMSDILKKNLLILGEDLKMKSRPLFVELFTTVLYHFISIIAPQFTLKEEDLRFYSLDEVREIMKFGKRVDQNMIAERQKSFVIYCVDERIIPLDGKDKALILERFKEKDHSKAREFKGTIANKGKVRGKALVILPELDIPYERFAKKLYSMKMDEGDILVSETTSPDFVPLMKRAGGIIANQGGLNSHAAIMARELGIPCLVATHHATEILKTGDMIELDADTGVVRILT